MTTPVVTLLTDYGLRDEFVGVCHGVIARICPLARIIDVTHGVPPQDVVTGALTLAQALPYLPVGVHVAVVDPDVGSRRRAVALATADERVLVGPDNGLLWPAAQAAGGIVRAVEISHSPMRLEPVAATFHGRDIFAPVAAHIAAGRAVAEVGEPFDPDDVVPIELSAARVEAGRLHASVSLIDRFGNVQLNAGQDELERMGLRPGAELEISAGSDPVHVARFVRTFADAPRGQLIAYEDAARRLALAVSHGSAAEHLGLRTGTELVLAPGGAVSGS